MWAWGLDGTVIDRDRRIVYRDDFQKALQTFIASYGAALVADTELQEAFARKFDDLCEVAA